MLSKASVFLAIMFAFKVGHLVGQLGWVDNVFNCCSAISTKFPTAHAEQAMEGTAKIKVKLTILPDLMALSVYSMYLANGIT